MPSHGTQSTDTHRAFWSDVSHNICPWAWPRKFLPACMLRRLLELAEGKSNITQSRCLVKSAGGDGKAGQGMALGAGLVAPPIGLCSLEGTRKRGAAIPHAQVSMVYSQGWRSSNSLPACSLLGH